MTPFTPTQTALISELADRGQRVLTVMKFSDKYVIQGTGIMASGKTPEEALVKLKEKAK